MKHFLNYLYQFKVMRWIHYAIVLEIVTYSPTRLGDYLRKFYVKLTANALGKNFVAHTGVQFFYPRNITIGDNVSFSRNTTVQSSAPIIIGDNVMFGPYCIIMTSNHGYQDLTNVMIRQKATEYPLIIEDDVWIGGGVIINSGSRPITIKKGVIVGSNAVVKRDCDTQAA